MPIYEYRCLDCSKVFEKIIWNNDQDTVTCPICKGANNIRVLSSFAKGSGATGKGIPVTSGCGPSSGGFS